MGTAKVLTALLLAVGITLTAVAVSSADPASASQQVGLVRTGAGTFSLDVQGADIRTVLRAISEFSGRNIVLANGVHATVNVSIKNVSWQDALRTVLRASGLDYVDEDGILRVDDAAKLNAEMVERESARAKAAEVAPLETRIIKLNYANASELAASLQASMTRRGSIQVERRTNSLIVADLPTSVDRIEKMAMDLDSTTPQIEITAKLVDVDTEALRGLGIEWNVGEPSNYFTGANAATAHVPNPGPGQDLGIDHKTSISDPATRISYGIFQSWGSFEAQLQLLEQSRKANIISNPRITTFDNREAKILVGQKIPLIVQDVAGNPVSQLQTIGIQLKVTPHLTQEKKIIMDLHPEVSDLSTQSTVQGGVIINTSEADTRVMVDDGQTAVIGGLIRTNDSNVRRGVPLLKDLPLIGLLFSSLDTVHQNRELIIFVTPRLLTTMASN
ncbi:MAG TPA: type IV pilus secretin PilQ [Candidatus Udaeobacter sp.]|jgi:type IV pilus assembly protein PilQ|nr:type IV pilus secretin PilQ [Candidatus Udaeobacter sp.]